MLMIPTALFIDANTNNVDNIDVRIHFNIFQLRLSVHIDVVFQY